MSKVSIIIPVYNAEKTIARCLDAILSQTYKDIEVICVNDGSKDNSFKILEEYSQKDSRIKVYNQENSGPARTRNFAISKASGDYLMFCDIDDWYESTMVEEMVAAIQGQDIDIAMCDANVIDLAEGKIQDSAYKKYIKIRLIGKHNITIKKLSKINVALWNKIFRMDLIKKYNITYPINYEHDDLIFFLKYMVFAKRYNGINRILYNYIVGNPESIMGKVFLKNNDNRKFDYIYAFSDLFNFLEKNPKANSKYKNYIIKIAFDYFNGYTCQLEEQYQEHAFQLFKDFVMKEAFFRFDKSWRVKNIKKANDYKEYCEYYSNKPNSLLQNIFSIKNAKDKTHKIITILGIKILLNNRIKKLKIEENVEL